MANNEIGGMILIHYHDNKAVLDAITEFAGKLYYNGSPVMTPISKQSNNALRKLADGLHVNSTYFLDKTKYDIISDFKVTNNILYFKGREVSQEYTELQMQLAVAEVWKLIDKEEGFEFIKKDETESEGK